MRITIEEDNFKLVISEEDLESYGLSIPSDIRHNADGSVELGRMHIALTGIFKDGVRAKWEAA